MEAKKLNKEETITLAHFIPMNNKGQIYFGYKEFREGVVGTCCEPYHGLFEVHKRGAGIKMLNSKQVWTDDQRWYDSNKYFDALLEYTNAKEKVIFKGFTHFKIGGMDYISNGRFQIEENYGNLILAHDLGDGGLKMIGIVKTIGDVLNYGVETYE